MFLLSRRLRISTSHKPFTSLFWLISIPDFDSPLLSPTFSSSSTAKSSDDDEESQIAHSFTLSYLVRSCGLSPESAIAASERVQFRNPKKPDSVIAFLRAHGFSETQVSRFIAKRPEYLLSDPEKTFLPKIEFFLSKGLSKHRLARLVSSYPMILHRSLNNHIVPTFDFFKSFLLPDEAVVSVMFSHKETLGYHLDNVVSNIRLFRELGFIDSNIGPILLNFGDVMIVKPEKLSEIVNKVKDMGFVPEKFTFLFALRMLSQKRFEDKWRSTYEIYSQWGWSEDDIVGAFLYHPNCMLISNEKIAKSMSFLVNVMGCPSKWIAKCPVVLFYSLEKRIIPRCAVVRALLAKGLLRQSDFTFGTVLQSVEKEFLDKFVTKYSGKLPQLLSVYRGKVDPGDV